MDRGDDAAAVERLIGSRLKRLRKKPVKAIATRRSESIASPSAPDRRGAELPRIGPAIATFASFQASSAAA